MTVKWPLCSLCCERAAGPHPLVIRCNCLEMRVNAAHTKGLLAGRGGCVRTGLADAGGGGVFLPLDG